MQMLFSPSEPWRSQSDPLGRNPSSSAVKPAGRGGQSTEAIGQGQNGEHSPRLGTRQFPRLRFEAKIDLRDGQSRLAAVVSDLSLCGLKLRTLSPLKVGDAFWVKLPTIEARHVTVRWTNGFVSGCAFDEPLSQYVLEHLTKKQF